MNRIWKISGFTALGIGSFFFFVYLMFPYNILKEALSLKVSEMSGINLSIGKLGVKLPVGVSLEDITISSQSAEKLELRHVSANLSVLSLLIGNLTVSFNIEDQKEGTIYGKQSFSLPGLLFGHFAIPHYVYLKADNFRIGPVIGFVLAVTRDSDAVSPLLKPLLESIQVGARLNSTVDLDINTNQFQKSQGEVLINLAELKIKSLTENIPIPDQTFSKAILKTTLKSGVMEVDKSSGFVSNDLTLGLSGKITQKPEFGNSMVDLKVDIDVGKGLQEHVGIILDAVAQKETNGKMQIKLHGTLQPSPSVTIL